MIYSEDGCGFVDLEDTHQVEVDLLKPPVKSFSRPLGGIIPDVAVPHLVKPEVVGTPSPRIFERDRVLDTFATTRSKVKARKHKDAT